MPILKPVALEALPASAKDVDLRLAIVLWTYADLRYDDLLRLCLENVVPGRSICLNPEPGKWFSVSVSIRPVLDAWLRPFASTQGRVIRSKNVRRRFRSLARSLGIPCNPKMLGRSSRAYSRALQDNAEFTSTAGGAIHENFIMHWRRLRAGWRRRNSLR